MSSAMTQSSLKSSRLAMPWMIRRFAWCGTNAASSEILTSARSATRSISGASWVVAQRNTV